ncbi:DUF4394 domain-containing protein [Nocardioides marinquilinus]|uniref:DUF4394 domain-containing protein n=1 Tax=Nocardioides marinquilinus TaxID=1210400 RepID=A0ABP9Q2I0_9ACTN
MNLLPASTRLRRTLAGAVAGTLVAGTAAVTLLPGGAEARTASERAYGLTAAGKLVTFDLRDPRAARTVGTITNLRGQKLVGIDIRPANGKIYGVGRGGGLFTINPKTARATRVGTFDVPLRGGSFGVDVNPAADALRVVSNTGQNLRHAFAGNVTTADAPLNITDSATGETSRKRGVTAVAYTNNDTSDATGTALFGIDTATDSVVLQVPANAGVITPQGALGRGTSWVAGFDVCSRIAKDRTVTNVGFATLGGKSGYALYEVGLLSGEATRVGKFPMKVTDLAVVHR